MRAVESDEELLRIRQTESERMGGRSLGWGERGRGGRERERRRTLPVLLEYW